MHKELDMQQGMPHFMSETRPFTSCYQATAHQDIKSQLAIYMAKPFAYVIRKATTADNKQFSLESYQPIAVVRLNNDQLRQHPAAAQFTNSAAIASTMAAG